MNFNFLIQLKLHYNVIIHVSISYRNELVFLPSKTIFFISFLYLGMHFFFPLHYGLHWFKVLHKWCSPHYLCIIWKETIERINAPKKGRFIIVFKMFFLSILFLLKNYFDMHFDNLIKFYASHHYYIAQAIWYQPIYTFASILKMKWVFIFQKKGKKPKHLTHTYLWNYLNKMNQITR